MQIIFELINANSVTLIYGFSTSLIICLLILFSKSWHGTYTFDTQEGIQKSHSKPTPRIGGLAVFSGVFVAWFYAVPEIKSMLGFILLAGLPAFIFGMLEDVTKKVGVLTRLFATMSSGLFACWLTGYSITRVDIWIVDPLLSLPLISILFTCFAVGGLANSINIIDGFNGLASTTSIIAFISIALIAYQVGDLQLFVISLLLAVCVLGFFLVNWPLGKIFLGDGGAYFIGFCLAWVSVMLTERNIQVSAFTVLLVCVHPVCEVLFSIFRRKIKKMHPTKPDRLHFHSLIKQRCVQKYFPLLKSDAWNSITGLLVGLLSLISGVMANLFYHSQLLLIIILITLSLGYVSIYARIVKYVWYSPFRFLMINPRNH